MTLRAILWRLLLIRLGVMRRRHRACLARIVALENEIWPQPRSKRDLEHQLFFGPGQTWIVEDPSYVQIMRNPWITNG